MKDWICTLSQLSELRTLNTQLTMAKVIPFRAVRPEDDKVHLVASRSVDGYNLAQLREKLAGNPFTFLHVINPDFDERIGTGSVFALVPPT